MTVFRRVHLVYRVRQLVFLGVIAARRRLLSQAPLRTKEVESRGSSCSAYCPCRIVARTEISNDAEKMRVRVDEREIAVRLEQGHRGCGLVCIQV